MTDKGGDSAPTEQSRDATPTLPWVPEFFFSLLLAAKIERRSRDRVTTYRRQSFRRSYRNTAHEIRHSSIWQHFASFLHITAQRADMSNYENKQIPQKTALASYLVSKSHGSAVRNCRDQRVFFPLVTRSRLRRSMISQPTTGKNTLWHPGYPDPESPEKSNGQSAICTMASFYYYDQNSFRFSFHI